MSAAAEAGLLGGALLAEEVPYVAEEVPYVVKYDVAKSMATIGVLVSLLSYVSILLWWSYIPFLSSALAICAAACISARLLHASCAAIFFPICRREKALSTVDLVGIDGVAHAVRQCSPARMWAFSALSVALLEYITNVLLLTLGTGATSSFDAPALYAGPPLNPVGVCELSQPWRMDRVPALTSQSLCDFIIATAALGVIGGLLKMLLLAIIIHLIRALSRKIKMLRLDGAINAYRSSQLATRDAGSSGLRPIVSGMWKPHSASRHSLGLQTPEDPV